MSSKDVSSLQSYLLFSSTLYLKYIKLKKVEFKLDQNHTFCDGEFANDKILLYALGEELRKNIALKEEVEENERRLKIEVPR